MSTHNGLLAQRRTVLYISKLLFLALSSLPVSWAAPIRTLNLFEKHAADPNEPADPSIWLDLAVSIFLVLLGGIFAGLTIALMGQDEINLQVIAKSGKGAEKKHAARVLRLLTRGKHWVLVTLLLSNVITNETLPIVLDRSLGGGWPAVMGSTIAIVIFGEIIPQSVCVRFGLAIGAWMSPFVLILMYLEAPVAYPTAKLLDKLIGEDHGTTYSKAGLKTLVTIHKTFGEAGERLNEDEVTIIGAVLELKNKPVGDIMTPMDDVFTMSTDTVLDEKMMETILSAGYSRIPIHRPDNPLDFVGMLLVKILITYDPEDCKPVRDFALATLPETAPETSCLDILNFFQEGKSHMVLVSENPGENNGAVGVITLEDVIEELIGEEIVDESDVFIDVHKAIRRLQPAPAARLSKALFTSKEIKSRDGSVVDMRAEDSGLDPISEYDADDDYDLSDAPGLRPRAPSMTLTSPKTTTLTLRRRSSGNEPHIVTTRSDSPDLREKLKHIGPSNLASRPRTTRFQSVKIKPGGAPEEALIAQAAGGANARSQPPSITFQLSQPTTGGVGEGLVRNAGIDAHDGVQALHNGYGTMESRPLSQPNPVVQQSGSPRPRPRRSRTSNSSSSDTASSSPKRRGDGVGDTDIKAGETSPLIASIGRSRMPRGMTRSGSITEQVIEYNGIRKVVLDVSSSSDDQPGAHSPSISGSATGGSSSDLASRGGRASSTVVDSGASANMVDMQGEHNGEGELSTRRKKKKRRRKANNNKGEGHDGPTDGQHQGPGGYDGDDADGAGESSLLLPK